VRYLQFPVNIASLRLRWHEAIMIVCRTGL